jgi:fructose-1,6-bisphosphatase/inositol monophosphatase family enzyme
MNVYAAGVNAAKTIQAFSVSIAMVESGSIFPGPDEGMKDEALTSKIYWPAKPL